MANIRAIYEHVAMLNTKGGSRGKNTASDKIIADVVYKEIISKVSKSSLAYKILTSSNFYTEKQLWAITYEIERNMNTPKQNINTDIGIKAETNKTNNKEILAAIKQAGYTLGAYYEFVKQNTEYRHEFYSKSFTNKSITAFISNKRKEELMPDKG